MSGRALHLRDGKLITNRKTDRRQTPRTPPQERPELTVSFIASPMCWLVSQGKYAGGIEVSRTGTVSAKVRTFNRAEVFQVVADFMRTVTPDGSPPYSISTVLTSSSEPGWKDVYRLTYVDGHVVAAKTPWQTLVFPRK